MIRDKRPTRGVLPDNLGEIHAPALIFMLNGLQAERVLLTTEATELRDHKDGAAGDLSRAKRAAEQIACSTLPAAKGKSAPAASAVKAFVDGDGGVLTAKNVCDDIGREVAANDLELGSVRSAIRIAGAVLDLRIEEMREKRAVQVPVTDEQAAGPGW